MNVVLVGFSGDGGYRCSIDPRQLEEFLKISFPSHRPSCLETGEPLDIEHHLVYNAFPVSFMNASVFFFFKAVMQLGFVHYSTSFDTLLVRALLLFFIRLIMVYALYLFANLIL